MKYMVTWRIPPNTYTPAFDRFLAQGAPLPDELTLVGRWHVPGSMRGWLLVEGDDMTALAAHLAEWAPYLELDVAPVIEDEDAAAAAVRVRDA